MKTEIKMDVRYAPSDNVVAREIEGELIIVPLTSGIGDLEEELFTVNKAGKAIWERLDGRNTVAEIVTQLSHEYNGSLNDIQSDVCGFMTELLSRKMIHEVNDE